MQLKLILAVLGAAFLSIGVFSPFLTIPVAGGISLFNRGLVGPQDSVECFYAAFWCVGTLKRSNSSTVQG